MNNFDPYNLILRLTYLFLNQYKNKNYFKKVSKLEVSTTLCLAVSPKSNIYIFYFRVSAVTCVSPKPVAGASEHPI